MRSTWIQYSDDRKRIQDELESSTYLLDTLKRILEDKMDTSNRKIRNKDGYKIANWTHSVAHQLGFQEALDMVLDLITIKEK